MTTTAHSPTTSLSDSASSDSSLGDSLVSDTRPLTRQLEEIVETLAKSQYELVVLAAEFADSP